MNELTTTTKHELAKLSSDEVELLKQTICKGATDLELKLFLQVCNKSGLDPFSRQIHAVKRWNASDSKMEMTIQTGIDGLRLFASRSGQYAGSSDPEFFFEAGNKFPVSATVSVWKIVQGQRCSFTATAYWEEFYPGDKQGFMWRKMPRTMLSKTAEAQALRKAFPNETSGIYADEELHRADAETVRVSQVLDDKEAIVTDYANKEKTIEQIRVAAGAATSGMDKAQKTEFMLKVMEVKSFGELQTLPVDKLEMILFQVNLELKKAASAPKVEEAPEVWPEVVAKDAEVLPKETKKKPSFKL